MHCPGSRCRLGSSSRKRTLRCRTHPARQRSAARQTRFFAGDRRSARSWPMREACIGQASRRSRIRSSGWVSTLTAAELRLLPLLTTHLSFREIAERLFVSRNTVKTQAIFGLPQGSMRPVGAKRSNGRWSSGRWPAAALLPERRLHPLGMMLSGTSAGCPMEMATRGGIQAHAAKAGSARRSVHLQRAAGAKNVQMGDARRNRPAVARPPEDRRADRARCCAAFVHERGRSRPRGRRVLRGRSSGR